MHNLTSDGRRYQLRIEMAAANGSIYYEVYEDFRIGPASDFTLYIGNFIGTAGNCAVKKNVFILNIRTPDICTIRDPQF